MSNLSSEKESEVTLDDLAGMVKIGFDAVDKRFDAVDKRFDAVDKRFDAVDKRFEEVDKRFDAVDKRFEEVETRLDRIENLVLSQHLHRIEYLESEVEKIKQD